MLMECLKCSAFFHMFYGATLSHCSTHSGERTGSTAATVLGDVCVAEKSLSSYSPYESTKICSK